MTKYSPSSRTLFTPKTSRESPRDPTTHAAQADARDAVAALGAEPPPAERKHYRLVTEDGVTVTAYSNRPAPHVLAKLAQRGRASTTTTDSDPDAALASDRPSERHIKALMAQASTPDDDELSIVSVGAYDEFGRFVPGTPPFPSASGIWVPERPQPSRGTSLQAMCAPGRALVRMPRLDATHASPMTVVTPGAGPLLSQRVRLFLDWVTQKKTTRCERGNTILTLKIFMELVGDKRVSQLTIDDADLFVRAVGAWPRNATKRRIFRGLTTQAVLRKAQILDEPPLHLRTQQKHIDRLRMFFRWLEHRQELRPGLLHGVRLFKQFQIIGTRRRGFDVDQLPVIFDPERQARFETPFKYWAPLLALYQGLRLNEIGQLYVADIHIEYDLPCMTISDNRPGQRVKNRQSRRDLPIHPTILACGFLEFVAQAKRWGRTTLFPKLVWGVNGPGDTIGDWFNRAYLRNHCQIADRGQTFHSFRHTFATLGERSGVPDGRLAQLLGHSNGDSILRTHYVQLAPARLLLKDLLAIAFPPLDHVPYDPARFEAGFAKANKEDTREARLGAAYGPKRLS